MRLLNRGEELPAELRQARIRLVGLLVEDAWQTAEALLAAETGPAERYDASTAAHDALLLRDPRRHTQGAERTEFTADVTVSAERLAAAKAALDAARDATTVAVLDAEDHETTFADLTGQRPPQGDGLRAHPLPLARGTIIATDPRDGSTVTVLDGTRPPRWLAWRLQPSAFTAEPPPEPLPVDETNFVQRESPSPEKQAQLDAADAADHKMRAHELAWRQQERAEDAARRRDYERQARNLRARNA